MGHPHVLCKLTLQIRIVTLKIVTQILLSFPSLKCLCLCKYLLIEYGSRLASVTIRKNKMATTKDTGIYWFKGVMGKINF